jgi:hypothetical protein
VLPHQESTEVRERGSLSDRRMLDLNEVEEENDNRFDTLFGIKAKPSLA